RGAAVGLPSVLGGVPYDKLGVTGYGVAEAADAATAEVGLNLDGARVAIQGFGSVGQAAAKRFVELGAVPIAIATAQGTVIDHYGVNIGELARLHDAFGDNCVVEYGNTEPAEAVLFEDVNLLVPAATQDVI